MMLNELTTSEIVWLFLGQLGLMLTMIGGVWIGITNHDDDKPALPFITMWFVYIISVAAAFLFTRYFKETSVPHVPWEANAFRLAVGMSFLAYPASRQLGIKRSMSQRLELIFSGMVAIVGVVSIGLAGYYGFLQYRAGNYNDNGYLTAQAKRNASMLQRDTTLTARMSHQVDSLTKLTHRQAGEVAGLTDRVEKLTDQVQESNDLIVVLVRKLSTLQGMITRLLGKPSLPVTPTTYPPKPEAVLDPRRVQSLPPAMHEKTN